MFRFTAGVQIALCVAAFSLLGANALAEQKPAKVLPREFTRGDGTSAPAAISGFASSARNCVGPAGAVVHPIGWVPASSDVVITFTSDFDPVAAVTLLQLGQDAPDRLARVSYTADDDGGGNLEPEIRFTTTFSGTLALNVSKFSADRQSGCYFYKVEIRTP